MWFASQHVDDPGSVRGQSFDLRGRGAGLLPASSVESDIDAGRISCRGCSNEESAYYLVVPDANRAAVAPLKDKIAKKELALVVADTLPVQIDQMKVGLSLG
jgi:DNA-binding transcriptional LysR family regulator